MTRISRPVLTVLVLFLGLAMAHAHRDATGIVKERMDAMVTMGRAMKALRAMMRGTEAYDAERVKAHAATIAGHGGEGLTALFPEGSLNHPTRADPAIWADWEGFAESARQLSMYAHALAGAASDEGSPARGGESGGASGVLAANPDRGPRDLAGMTPDAIFKHLQRTCSDCHRAFRTKN